MKGTISDIWQVVDEYVDDNLDVIFEDDLDPDMESSQALEDDILADVVPDYDDDFVIEDNDEVNDDPDQWDEEKNFDYWMQEFEQMIKDYVPDAAAVETKGASPGSLTTFLLGTGGVLLLGLITSAAVLIRIKRSARKIRSLPVVAEPVEETQAAPPVEKKEPQRMPRPFFYMPYPAVTLLKRAGGS